MLLSFSDSLCCAVENVVCPLVAVTTLLSQKGSWQLDMKRICTLVMIVFFCRAVITFTCDCSFEERERMLVQYMNEGEWKDEIVSWAVEVSCYIGISWIRPSLIQMPFLLISSPVVWRYSIDFNHSFYRRLDPPIHHPYNPIYLCFLFPSAFDPYQIAIPHHALPVTLHNRLHSLSHRHFVRDTNWSKFWVHKPSNVDEKRKKENGAHHMAFTPR